MGEDKKFLYCQITFTAEEKYYAVIVQKGNEIHYISGFCAETGVEFTTPELNKAKIYDKSTAKRIVSRINAIGYLKVK